MDTTAHLNVSVLTFVIATAIPILVGFLAKIHASSTVKAVLNLTLAVVATTVQLALDANGVVNLKSWLTTALVTWIIGISTYYGFLKPTGVTTKVAAATPEFGFGTNAQPWNPQEEAA